MLNSDALGIEESTECVGVLRCDCICTVAACLQVCCSGLLCIRCKKKKRHWRILLLLLGSALMLLLLLLLTLPLLLLLPLLSPLPQV